MMTWATIRKLCCLLFLLHGASLYAQGNWREKLETTCSVAKKNCKAFVRTQAENPLLFMFFREDALGTIEGLVKNPEHYPIAFRVLVGGATILVVAPMALVIDIMGILPALLIHNLSIH